MYNPGNTIRKGPSSIISCSRRTDIPRCYPGWLEDRLAAGSVTFKGPRGGERTVALEPAAVHSMVLWSKDYGPLLERPGLLRRLDVLNPLFHFTITGLGGSVWEPGIPGWKRSLEVVESLVERYGPERVNWRFDPLVHWQEGEGVNSNLRLFTRIGTALKALGIGTCTFSFAHWYLKSQRRAAREVLTYVEIPPDKRLAAAAMLAQQAAELGLRLASCSSPDLEMVPGVRRAHCVDGGLLSELRGDGLPVSLARDQSQRAECGCTRSVDIGSYTQRCEGRHCIYCYAN
jgi:hypothetical protein